MKPVLENISIPNTEQSILIFEREETHFESYWHYHPELELTLILNGTGTRFVGDSIQQYTDYDLVLVGCNLPHQWVSSPKEGEVQKAIVVQFPMGIFSHFPEFKAICVLLHQADLGIHFKAPSDGLISEICKLPELSESFALTQLFAILCHLIALPQQVMLSKKKAFSQTSIAQNPDKISKTISFIVRNLDRPLNITQMAEETHMQPQSFCRWFKKQTGNSFIAFLNSTRIQHACQYLKSSDLQVQEIALKVGFEHVSHFNRTFKKLLGMSPLEFRKQEFSS